MTRGVLVHCPKALRCLGSISMNCLLCARSELLPGKGPLKGTQLSPSRHAQLPTVLLWSTGTPDGEDREKAPPVPTLGQQNPRAAALEVSEWFRRSPGVSAHLCCSDKTPQTECLINNGNHCSQLRGWKSQVMVLGESVSDENHGS